MTWKPKLTEHLADTLRFIAKGALLTDGILLALASIYLTVRFCHRAVQYLDIRFFSTPWTS